MIYSNWLLQPSNLYFKLKIQDYEYTYNYTRIKNNERCLRDFWWKRDGGVLFIYFRKKKKNATVCPKGQEIIWPFWPLSAPPPPSPEGTVTTTVKFFKWFEIMKSYIFKQNLTQHKLLTFQFFSHINVNNYSLIIFLPFLFFFPFWELYNTQNKWNFSMHPVWNRFLSYKDRSHMWALHM